MTLDDFDFGLLSIAPSSIDPESNFAIIVQANSGMAFAGAISADLHAKLSCVIGEEAARAYPIMNPFPKSFGYTKTKP